MSRIQTITHKGKEIIYIDFARARLNEISGTLDELKKQVSGMQQNSTLILVNVAEMQFNTSVSDAFKGFFAQYGKNIRASAVFGLEGIHKLAYNFAVKMAQIDMPVFDTKDQALDYLTGK